MRKQSIRKSLILNDLLFQIISACILGLILGFACGWFSSPLVLGIPIVGLLIYVALRKPEITLLGILIATSSILFQDQLPQFSVGISLHVPDFILLGLLALIIVRWLVEPGFKLVNTPLDRPLLFFYGVVLFTTFLAIFRSTTDVVLARRMLRDITYYLIFFPVTTLIRERRQLLFLLNGLLILATIVGAVMVAQYLLGGSVILLPGRVETLQTQGTSFYGVTRVLPPGQSIVVVAFITISVLFIMDLSRMLNVVRIVQWVILGMAVLVSFTRGYWVQAGLALLLTFYFARRADKLKLIGLGLTMLVSGGIILSLLLSSFAFESRTSRLMDATLNRVSTLFEEDTLQEGSLRFREIENQYAIEHIFSHPILGTGLGSYFRPYDRRIDGIGASMESTTWIHNGHLWILLDTGLLGYGFFMWLSITFLVRGFRNWRRIQDVRLRGIVLGFTLAYLGILLGAVLRPMIVDWAWVPVIGTMMGINEVISKNYRTGQVNRV